MVFSTKTISRGNKETHDYTIDYYGCCSHSTCFFILAEYPELQNHAATAILLGLAVWLIA